MRLNKIIYIACLVILTSCVDRFIPETTGYDKVLFIECLLSDSPDLNPLIHISLSAPVVTEEGGKLTYKPVGFRGARATVLCSDGIRYEFHETNAGTYSPDKNLNIEYGKSYKLIVSDGDNNYESDYQQLRTSPQMDDISFKPVFQKRREDAEVIEGYRFYVSTHDSLQNESFYRWSMDATFRYEAPYSATHVWDGRTTIPASNRLIRTCWKSKNIPGTYIAKTTGLAENRIIESPLNFESQYGDELTIRYSLNVRQLSISESAYTFWENLKKLVSETGSLYETQPFRIEGNIHCISDPSVYVAGIFEVAGVSEMRTFVNKPTEFPVIPLECILMEVGGEDFPWYRLPAGSYVTEVEPGKFMTASPFCYDCRLRDGTLEKPPFWKDR